MDPVRFREAMRSFAGAVTIVTTGPVGRRFGLTATSVCSLSDAPPTLLVCVNRQAAAHDAIHDERCFGVNVLSLGQAEEAECFAGRLGLRAEERFAVGRWDSLVTGAPLIRDAAVNFDCELAGEYTFSTHSIFFGTVRDIRVEHDAEPLLYLRGMFAGTHPVARASPAFPTTPIGVSA